MLVLIFFSLCYFFKDIKKVAILVTVVGHILLILAVQRELTKTQNNIVSYLDICGFSDFEEPENT